jgi:hypothetical protein
MIEFELTDIGEARAAHDLPPPGLVEASRLQPDYYQKRRRAPLATDRALTGCSLDWLMQLPPMLRPDAMCERFPRIVNSISESWHDTEKALDVFEHLLSSRRTGRRGFPTDVLREIEMLCEHRVTLASMPPSP